MRSPANAERLQKAMCDYKEGKGFRPHELLED